MLLYLLLADRDVEIVADRGIHAQRRRRRVAGDLPQDGGGVPRGPLRRGVEQGIAEISALLAQHFAAQRAGRANEIADAPVVL